jgi:hypothetical protein
MDAADNEILKDLIELTVANAAMIADLRQNNRALRRFLEKHHPDFESKFLGFWADADGRGGDLYEAHLAKVRKLAAKRDLLHKRDTTGKTL